MLKRLFGGNSFRGIIDEDFLQKVEEISAEFVVIWYNFLLLSACALDSAAILTHIQPLHGLDKPSRGSSGIWLRVIEF
jgi:hypothetical protein